MQLVSEDTRQALVFSFIHSLFANIVEFTEIIYLNVRWQGYPKKPKAYYIWAREHEGTERDTEGVGYDTS